MTTISNGSPGGHRASNSLGAALGPFTAGGSGGSGPTRKLPLKHIDDVLHVTVDCDPHMHMDKLLSMAEDFLHLAESSKSFGGRIDIALMSYIKANIILADLVKKNKGWVSLQSDNLAQRERYTKLAHKVKAAHRGFESLKSEIKADNARSGILPETTHRQPGVPPTSSARAALTVPNKNRVSLDDEGSSDGTPTPAASPTPPKTKPTVHPKPKGLHGNAIQPGGGGAKRTADDLNSRFAKLRAATAASQPAGAQDPRIRTQPIVSPSPAGRRNALAAPGRSSLSLDTNVFDMPKLPDAIYKPARGTVSTEAAELPSSTSHRFSLARSLTSGSLNSPAVKPSSSGPNLAFSGAPNGQHHDGARRTKLTLPEGDTISVTDLVRLMKEGSKTVSILLIDIRSREAFDEGHIMSQATICLEPEVLVRDGISAGQIADSMVLAPATEQINFERRDEFDLIVFYDQGSTRIDRKNDSEAEKAVQGLYNALAYYDRFDGENNSKRPKLLEGGLDAWTSVMGNNSLASTDGPGIRPSAYSEKTRPSTHTTRRRQSHVPRPIQDPVEARLWEESTTGAEAFTPVTDVNDFLRRFPPASALKESMTSPTPIPVAGDGAYSDMHSEPKRPPPTVLRQSHSGLAERDDPEGVKRAGKIRSQGEKRKNRTLVGLMNPGQWCYANTSLQVLFGTRGFVQELFTGQWEDSYKVPMKRGEKIPNPQLLSKMLAQLFAWMDKGMIHPMEARTLMQYMKHIHGRDESGRKRPGADVFGGTNQHDAQEFFSYIIEQLHDETNKFRNQEDRTPSTVDNGTTTALHDAVNYWLAASNKNFSIVTKYWRGVTASITRCRQCGGRTVSLEVFDITLCEIPQKATLTDSLARYTEKDIPVGFKCDDCGKKRTREKQTAFARLPDRLAFTINRFDMTVDPPTKDHTRFSFPIRGLDMEPYFVPKEERAIDTSDRVVKNAAEERQYKPPFIYDCYAVICHIGAGLKSGHYINYVRDQHSDDPTDWIKFDDTKVERVKVGTGGPNDETEDLYKSKKGNQQAYMIFYERRKS